MTTQFRKIVIGIDFSDASLAGARWVSTHLAPRAELLLVHVVPLPRPPIYLHEPIGLTIDQRSTLVPHLYRALRGFADLLSSDRVRVGIRSGVPWSALARVADDVRADLICVGRGPKRQGSSRFGATTPQRLLAISQVPVLVIPQGVVSKPGRVFAALSGRPGGERVIPVAKALAAAWGSRLEPIHVIEADVHQVSRTSTGTPAAKDWIGTTLVDSGRRIRIDALDQSALHTLAGEWVASTVSAAGATESGPGIPSTEPCGGRSRSNGSHGDVRAPRGRARCRACRRRRAVGRRRPRPPIGIRAGARRGPEDPTEAGPGTRRRPRT